MVISFDSDDFFCHSTLLNLSITFALTLLLVGVYIFLELFRVPSDLLPLIRPYFILQMVSFGVYMASAALKQFFDGMGRTQVPMWIILSSNLLNVIGNYLLIFGKWGCPELGLYGAGLSTLLSRIYMLVALTLVLRYSRSFKVISRATLERSIFPAYFVRLFRLGTPISIQTGVETAAWTFAIIIVTPTGRASIGCPSDPMYTHCAGLLGLLRHWGCSDYPREQCPQQRGA